MLKALYGRVLNNFTAAHFSKMIWSCQTPEQNQGDLFMKLAVGMLLHNKSLSAQLPSRIQSTPGYRIVQYIFPSYKQPVQSSLGLD